MRRAGFSVLHPVRAGHSSSIKAPRFLTLIGKLQTCSNFTERRRQQGCQTQALAHRLLPFHFGMLAA